MLIEGVGLVPAPAITVVAAPASDVATGFMGTAIKVAGHPQSANSVTTIVIAPFPKLSRFATSAEDDAMPVNAQKSVIKERECIPDAL